MGASKLQTNRNAVLCTSPSSEITENILTNTTTIFPPNINNNTIRILNNNNLNDVTTNSIGEFYRGSNVFITGATGFVGKALLEKLLRSCDLLDTVHLLMRPKRGLGIEQRLKELLKNPVCSFSNTFVIK